MTITNARWIDEERTGISAVVDGQQLWIPVDPLNRHYAEILRQDIAVAPPNG